LEPPVGGRSMSSVAKVLANRSNAQKSPGPRTPRGKSLARLNAVRLGVYAKNFLIRGEDPGEFRRLEQAIVEELAPSGIIQSTCVREIVLGIWRRFRLERAEVALYARAESENERRRERFGPTIHEGMSFKEAQKIWMESKDLVPDWMESSFPDVSGRPLASLDAIPRHENFGDPEGLQQTIFRANVSHASMSPMADLARERRAILKDIEHNLALLFRLKERQPNPAGPNETGSQ